MAGQQRKLNFNKSMNAYENFPQSYTSLLCN